MNDTNDFELQPDEPTAVERLWIIGMWALGAIVLVMLALALFLPKAHAEGISKVGAPISIGAVADVVGWTGFNAYGAIGYGFTRSEFETVGNGQRSLNAKDVLVTGGIGYDVQLSNIVLGAMADVTASRFDDVRWQWFVGLRGGVLITPKTLAYGLVGYTEDVDGVFAFKLAETTKLNDLAGLTLGGGLEHAFGGGWAGRLEYRYVSFGTQHAPQDVPDGLVDGSKIDSGEHQVRLGVVKRF